MKTLIKTSAAIVSLLFLNSVQAVEISAELNADYQAGLAGNADANQRAIEKLQDLVTENGSDPVAISMLGSSETTRARYVDQPWEKIQYAEKGLARLDKSLQLLAGLPAENRGDLMKVTTTAGCTFISVPKMFNRLEQGFEILKSMVDAPSFAHVPANYQVRPYLCAAQAAANLGHKEQASGYIATLVKIAPQGPHMASVEKLQAQLGE